MDTGEDHVQLVIFELVEEFAVDNGKSYLARGSVYHVGLSDDLRDEGVPPSPQLLQGIREATVCFSKCRLRFKHTVYAESRKSVV